jgi:dihydroorotate dehydrogenase (NAD+) catalytic subunit
MTASGPLHAPGQPAATFEIIHPSLAVTLAGIEFPTPVLAAPGPLEFGRQVQSAYDLRAFGGFITKSVTLEPREGHPGPDTVQVPGGWLNAVGLRNPGVGAFIARDLPFLRTLGRPVIVSVAGHSEDEFAEVAEALDAEDGVAGLEVNISCPNVDDGLLFGTDPARTHALVARVRAAARRPLFVKLTPNCSDVVAIALAAADAGADGLSLINTLQGLAVDPRTRRGLLGAGIGGLSGRAIKPVALRVVWEVTQRVRLPIIGMGGITTGEDAVEFLLCGAHAVAVATAVLDNPHAATDITEGLRAFMIEQHVAGVADLVGTLAGVTAR